MKEKQFLLGYEMTCMASQDDKREVAWVGYVNVPKMKILKIYDPNVEITLFKNKLIKILAAIDFTTAK